jgi:hypothetical protein
MTDKYSGGCMCGAIRFQLTKPPYEVDYCHCHSCRKHTGAPVSVFANCMSKHVDFLKGAPRRYESSSGVWRGFCLRCGSTLSYESAEFPGEIHFHIGALDRPQDLPPTGGISFPEERLPWFGVKWID